MVNKVHKVRHVLTKLLTLASGKSYVEQNDGSVTKMTKMLKPTANFAIETKFIC